MEKLFIFGIGGLTGSKLATIGKEDYEIFGSYNIRNPKFNFSRSEKLNITNFEIFIFKFWEGKDSKIKIWNFQNILIFIYINK